LRCRPLHTLDPECRSHHVTCTVSAGHAIAAAADTAAAQKQTVVLNCISL
jgi:hypothetical protein